MQKKILFCATVDYHFEAFHLPILKWFKEQGWEVHIAAAGDRDLPFVDKKFKLPIHRSPINKENFTAYKELKTIIDRNQYQIVHSHTPMGGALSRLAARNTRKKGTKVMYTAHGFHFCKGAPLINWMLYYPIEKTLAKWTDCLITINNEDYKIAVNRNFKAEIIKHVHGVGVDTERFHPITSLNKKELRSKHGYNEEDFLMFYAAEFNRNKNQQLLIQALALLKKEVPNAKLLLAGDGPLLEECKKLAATLGVSEMIDFLGFRKDIDSLLKISDLAVASSLREGLPVNIMEAMACGLPIIANDNRGHRELINNGHNGWLVYNDANTFAKKIQSLATQSEKLLIYGNQSRKMIEEKYSAKKVLEAKSGIYKYYMDGKEELAWTAH
ncbi:glycosyltransferase family 4 protein [Peribacillus sp. JNUCC 23]